MFPFSTDWSLRISVTTPPEKLTSSDEFILVWCEIPSLLGVFLDTRFGRSVGVFPPNRDSAGLATTWSFRHSRRDFSAYFYKEVKHMTTMRSTRMIHSAASMKHWVLVSSIPFSSFFSFFLNVGITHKRPSAHRRFPLESKF